MRAFVEAYDKVNLGDDLFVRFLANRYPHVRFTMLSDPANRAVFRDVKNLRIIDKDGPWLRLLRRIRPSLGARYVARLKARSHACIYIGGSIFEEYENWRAIADSWEYQTTHYPYYVLGANFGPYHTPAYADRMKQVFTSMADICFRDRYSYELFADLPNVRQAPDILFAQPFPAAQEQKQVFVSVIDCAARDELAAVTEAYEQMLYGLMQSCLEGGYAVKLASFCRTEGDGAACGRLMARFADADKKPELLCYTGQNHAELLREIAASAYVVGTRFHATVLGLGAGRRVLPVIYSDKTKNMLADAGFTGGSIDLRQTVPTMDLVALQAAAGTLEAAPLRTASARHFEKLDKRFGER